MRTVIVDISECYLRELLQLPADASIVDARVIYDRPGVLQLKIQGAGDEVAPGAVIPQVTGKVMKRAGEPAQIYWPFASSSWPFPEPHVH